MDPLIQSVYECMYCYTSFDPSQFFMHQEFAFFFKTLVLEVEFWSSLQKIWCTAVGEIL